MEFLQISALLAFYAQITSLLAYPDPMTGMRMAPGPVPVGKMLTRLIQCSHWYEMVGML